MIELIHSLSEEKDCFDKNHNQQYQFEAFHSYEEYIYQGHTWCWCLVGNITEKHEYGEEHEIKYGTKHFSRGTKVYLAPAQWGDGYENIVVIGMPRHQKKFIEVITRSKYIENYYAEAFQIDKSKIKSLGLPRADYYFENHDIDELRSNFNKKYGVDSSKKIILYTPTFRENKEFNNVFNFLDLDEFNKKLSDEYVLVLRLHPKIKKFYSSEISVDGDYVDCSDYKNEQELLLLSDILITDYSSIMIEFGLLNKPIIFFAYDLDNYLSNERGFYLDYKNDLPGPIVYTTEELISCINDGIDSSNLDSFIKTQFDEINGNASKRIVDFVLNESRKNG